MSKFRIDPAHFGLLTALAQTHRAPFQKVWELQEKQTRWANTIQLQHPTVDRVYLQTVSEEIIRRAEIISMQSPVESTAIASFFLDRTLAWVMAGMAVPKIGPALPRNLEELGEMILRERVNPLTGGKLTAADLQPIKKGSRKKHVRTQ